MRRFAFIAFVMLLSALRGASAGDEPPPAAPKPPPLDATTRDFDQIDLDISIRPDCAAGSLEGQVGVTFAPTVPSLSVLRLHAQDMEIRSVRTHDGRDLVHKREADILSIEFPTPIAQGTETRVEVAYTARPTKGLFFHQPCDTHPDRPLLLYSQGQGNENRRWIPCYDLPDDRSTFSLAVRVPADLTTVGNGVRKASEAHGDGTRTDSWRFDSRAPSYLISLVVGRFESVEKRWRDVVLEFHGPPGRRDELENSLGATADMMEVFSTQTGLVYPWPRYAQTYVWDFVYGGMENVTSTTLNMRALHHANVRPNYRSEPLVAHELAHMWFGDLITCRTWEHIWLNEGFATYFTDLYFEERFGREEFLFRRRSQNRDYMREAPTPETLGLKRDPRGDRPIELSGGKAYSRGSAVLHALRREIGDEAFFRGIRDHVAQHRDRAVTSEEFRVVMEHAAGVDLRWFFDTWVYGAGYPRLQVEVDRERRMLRVAQVQGQAGGQGLFRLSVPVRMGTTGPLTTLSIYRDRHTFPLPASFDLDGDAVIFGEGGDLLMAVAFEQSPSSSARILAEAREPTDRADAAEALESFGEIAVSAWAKALADDVSWGVRRTVAELLGRVRGPAAARALRGATSDADPRVREAVAEALGGFTRDEAGTALVAQAGSEAEHPYVRAAAAHAAGRVKATGAYEVLEQLLAVDSHVDVVRAGALRGLAALGARPALPRVLPYLDYAWGRGANHSLRQAALATALQLAPDDAAVRTRVARLLDDPYHRMREWAAEACGTHRIDEAREALQRRMADDWHGGTREAAKRAIEALDKPTDK